ncbi:MAG: aldehyde dehydrogenase family protein [Rhodobacteraceae bacterium]|nr:aldehyde dehydrogenase family protein [Paracoccaceae bacterium]
MTAPSPIAARNPRTGVADYRFIPNTPADVAALAADLRAAQPAWQVAGLRHRITVLEGLRDAMARHADALRDAVETDTGRVFETTIEQGVAGVWVDRWSRVALETLEPQITDTETPGLVSKAGFSPYPVVGIISPWNFPLALSLMDAIPALLAGCAVMIKPSEVTPRFIDVMDRVLDDLPDLRPVLRYLRGAGDVGAAVVEHSDLVCFTGSTATGRKVAAQAGARFIPCFTELGGKDPAVILPGADLARAAKALANGATLGSGQQCYSIERIYIPRADEPAFLKLLLAEVSKLHLSYPDPKTGDIGPLTFAPQAEVITRHLADAVAKGAMVHCGGAIEHHGGGLWCPATVLSGVTHDMQIMTEETFGPILPVMAYDSVDQAVALANDSSYGLSAAVFGPEDDAIAIAERLWAGGVSINDAGIAPMLMGDRLVAEKTAFRGSGLGGSRLGRDALKRFVRKQAIIVNRNSGASPWWYETLRAED